MTSPRITIWLLVAAVAAGGALSCRKPREEQPPTSYEPTPAPARAPAQKLPGFDLWYRIQADGQPIGYRHVSLATASTRQGPVLELRTDQRTRITAGGQPAAQRLRLHERCAPDGALISLAAERRTASQTWRRKYVVDGQTLVTIDPDSGTRAQAKLPTGPPLSGLCGLYLALTSGAASLALRTLDPTTGKLVTGHVLRTPGTHDQYRYAESSQPQVKTELFLGPSRLPVKMTVTGLDVTLRLTLSTRAEAADALQTAPERPSRGLAIDLHARLPEPLDAERIRYGLTLPEPLPPAALAELSRDNQRRLPGGDAARPVVEVTRPVPLPTTAAMPYPPTPASLRPARAWLGRATPSLPPRDPRRAQLAVLLRGTDTTLRAVLRLTSWAAIAPARGFKDRAGLLVAALRAAGIPARLVYGFLYVGSVMTEHAWVEAWLGTWLALDPEIGRAAGPTHLRLATSPADPTRHPDTTWRQLKPQLAGLRARLLEARLASGFRFVPGARANANQTANVLFHRVWNLVVRRPFTARFVLPGPADPYDLAVVSSDARLHLQLVLYAASSDGLDPAAFRAQGYRPRQIGLRHYLVRDLDAKAATRPAVTRPAVTPPAMLPVGMPPGMAAATPTPGMRPAGMPPGKTAATPTPGMAAAKPSPAAKPIAGRLRRRYVQISCSSKPWGARLVRWTLTAKSVDAKRIADFESKVLGTFQMTGHPAGVTACAPSKSRPAPR